MKAAVQYRFGAPEVVRIEERPTPVPGPGQALVRVRATPVTAGDARLRAARFPSGFGPLARPLVGFRKPRVGVLGMSFSGVVEAVGSKVSDWQVGDEVCGTTGMRMGAHAELVLAKPAALTRKPPGVSHEQAAALIFGATTALFFLRRQTSIRPGQLVLVVGASGAVGTNIVQIARLDGARVTGVCSAANADLVRRLGAERVIDYSTTDVRSLPERYDVVVDTVGTLGLDAGRRLLTPDGTLLLVVGTLWEALRARGNVRAGTAPDRVAEIETALALVTSGQLEVVIEESFGLDSIVEAHRRVDSGRKVGNVVVLPQA